MKKMGFFTIMIILAFSFTNCNTTGKSTRNITLDQAVQSSAQTIETRLPQGAKVAVLAFTSSSQGFSDYVIDELATAINARDNLQIIERQYMDAIRMELNIQMSGDVSDDEVRRVGKQLGAQYVVTGSLVDVGNAYRFRVVAINVESAVREGSSSLNINKTDPHIVFLLNQQPATAVSSTGNNTDKVYKIGERGPADGFIFYDKYEYSDGWRYLEVAPASTEIEAAWGSVNLLYDDLSDSIQNNLGSGKKNTELIVERLRSLDEFSKAVQYCKSLEYGSYNDWFLPSLEELKLVYKFSTEKKLGDFNTSFYWSSSIDAFVESHSSLGSITYPFVWVQNFYNGEIRRADGYHERVVRAIRAF